MINKSRRGFGRFEVLTIMVIILIIICFLMYVILKGLEKQKFITMKNSALEFSNIVIANKSSFHNDNIVYLEEVIDEDLIKNIKSPFSEKNCDSIESKIEIINGKTLVTLKCDNYLIDKAMVDSLDKIEIFKVSEWSLKKQKKSNDERQMFNCIKNSKDVYPIYKEEFNLIYNINKEFGTNYYFLDEIGEECEVIKKDFYRSRELVNY